VGCARFRIGMIALCLAASAAAQGMAETAPDMVRVMLRDDFETGELNAWESYPIAEDPGFDPEILCVKEPSFQGSMYSLAKMIKPNDTDFPVDENLVGMTKKIRIRTTSDSELTFAAFMDGDRKAGSIAISLPAVMGSPRVRAHAG